MTNIVESEKLLSNMMESEFEEKKSESIWMQCEDELQKAVVNYLFSTKEDEQETQFQFILEKVIGLLDNSMEGLDTLFDELEMNDEHSSLAKRHYDVFKKSGGTTCDSIRVSLLIKKWNVMNEINGWLELQEMIEGTDHV